MYGVDHIRRVLTTFPGVFSGIGEFSIHKEFVSSKISGETASLTNPALDRILDFAAESGLVVILHNDVDMPFAKPDTEPAYLTQMKALLKRHPKTTIIWAHIGLGRIVRPVQVSAEAAERYQGAGGDRRSDADRSGPEAREFRHLVGRSGQVRRRLAGVDQAGIHHPESISRPILVWHGHSRPRRTRALLQSVRHVGTNMGPC
jgi:hypothetical protein